ncbi:hypothetical protein A3J90_05860 [candidate division WOR-1 bacterium RIFOXYC2_FULL_37_10]|uniref:PDZ domain-containing protein n=1 Tax=candidate division WOR-1 bacterium RIFOXYB2_FULL_37_13 TaxID=1802579 RepID=A0A1F4SQ07_UNCSA|nr:MAG: hypothetical protein A2310_07205 [candidate division WOR-1 bacterium RIFOXYB2_FULL_37_13]OGC34911.1 MAG: hypothetical protein A3J90_05860 [candidate division WOR-1 bacterium RIFOXYC2_FULL_37_10]
MCFFNCTKAKFSYFLFIFFLIFLPAIVNSAESTYVAGVNTLADVVEITGSAVVNIDTIKMEGYRFVNPFSSLDNDFGFEFDPRFKDFFHDKIIPLKGAGSGFIINKEGYILTNDHVIEDTDKIKVTLKDGRSFNAKLIGKDETLDLAVIKIEAIGLPTLILGDSNKIRPGEWVISIGNPYGFSNTATAGIISATGRSLGNIGNRDLIQTDAAINPGNSGGPLLNIKGEVIGINVAIIAQAQGIGFAIPINAAKEVLQDLIIKGKVTRPWLGIYMRDTKHTQEGTVVITNVIEKSPADKMGLKKFDVIKEINSKSIASSAEIKKIISDLRPYDTIEFKIYRRGENFKIKGVLGEK